MAARWFGTSFGIEGSRLELARVNVRHFVTGVRVGRLIVTIVAHGVNLKFNLRWRVHTPDETFVFFNIAQGRDLSLADALCLGCEKS
jgi:hypothetical protein